MALERVSWIKNGDTYRRIVGNLTNVEAPEMGIYAVNFNPMEGWSLERTEDKFTFGYKVYDLQTDFINHVVKTFNNISGNLGILLNGIKGTGKTVTAKVLANTLNLPIIIVKSFGDNNSSLVEYLSSFNFDCVFFFDEFEKNWNENDCSILQIMDGVYTSKYRRVFLLTTNSTTINENLISRPSRIRYFKEFGNIDQSVVLEYLADNLQDKSLTQQVVDFVDTLEISTIDILKTIVEDVNIHGFETFMENRNIFNIKTAHYYYSLYKIGFNSFDEVKEDDFDAAKFLKNIKLYETVKAPSRYAFDTDEEFAAARDEYFKKRCHYSVSSESQSLDRSIRSVKLGDRFGYYDDEHIIKIDLANKMVVTKDSDDNSIYFYYIRNIDAKPSLYSDYASSSAALTNPYYYL